MFVARDAETGGFSEKSNPLLSLGCVISEDDGRELGTFYRRCLPPSGTVLELPPELADGFAKFIDVYTGEPVAERGDRLWISYGAVKANGYVELAKLNPHKWVEPAWHIDAVQPAEAVLEHTRQLEELGVEDHLQVYHNADFDLRILRALAPSPLWDMPVYCTMKSLRKYNADKGLKGASLGDLRKVAQADMHDVKKAHTALQDAHEAYLGYLFLTENGY